MHGSIYLFDVANNTHSVFDVSHKILFLIQENCESGDSIEYRLNVRFKLREFRSA